MKTNQSWSSALIRDKRRKKLKNNLQSLKKKSNASMNS